MLTTTPAGWLPRLLTLAVWALVAGSAVFWGLRWQGDLVLAPALAALPSAAAVDSAAVARLLGNPDAAPAPAVSAPSRFALTGVVARTASQTGAALIAIDGKAARAFSVGTRLEEGLFLLSVAPRAASLGNRLDGPTSILLELPAPKAFN